MEEIKIMKGNNLIEKFAPTSDFVESDWAKGITAQCTRSIMEIE